MQMTFTVNPNNKEDIKGAISTLKTLLGEHVGQQALKFDAPEAVEDKTEVQEAQTPTEAKKEPQTAPTRKRTVKKKEPEAPTVTLSDLKDLAQELTKTHDRLKIKEIINNYATKLSDVKESDYDALMAELKAL